METSSFTSEEESRGPRRGGPARGKASTKRLPATLQVWIFVVPKSNNHISLSRLRQLFLWLPLHLRGPARSNLQILDFSWGLDII